MEREFLATELHGFLRGMLSITAPVTLLTAATRRIEQGEEAGTLLPVTTEDELGQMSDAFNRMTNALHTQKDVRRRLS